MMRVLGPSIAFGMREYRDVWGSEQILVKLQDELIKRFTVQPWQEYNLPGYVGNDIRRLWQQLRGLR